MAQTFVWTINQLQTAPSLDGLTDVVVIAHWTYTLNDLEDDGTSYTASSYSTVSFGPPNPESFTAYDSLSEQDVVSWVETTLGEKTVLGLQTYLQENIANQKNPPIVVLPLPWTPSPPAPEPVSEI